jgi:hypothetical protein
MNEVGNESAVRERKVIKVSRWKFILTIVVIVLALIVWGLSSVFTAKVYQERSSGNVNSLLPSDSYNESVSKASMVRPDYYGGGQSDITDTREFLKTSYSASIETRDVEGVITTVKNMVKGADGRIDSISSSEKSGRISFVVPKSKFDAFKDEVESITHKKLYTENVSSQNLLTQKQNIEEQTSNVNNTLTNLKEQKKNLDIQHTQAVSKINNSLESIQSQLLVLRISSTVATNTEMIAVLRNQENSLIASEIAEKQKLNAENNSYATKNSNLQNQIVNAEQDLTNVNKKDNNFTNNIETVNGYVSASWVSIWGLAVIFSPIHPIFVIIILIIAVWYYLKRKSYIPKIVLE